MTIKILALAAMTAAVVAAGAAQAQQVCAPRTVLVEKLKSDFNEKPRGVGLADTGGLIEFLASKEGTWTLIMTSPEGKSCLLMAGEKWKAREMEKGDGTGQASAKEWPPM